MKILNLTLHKATQQQLDAGLVDLTGKHKVILDELLNFNYLPSTKDMMVRAYEISEIPDRLGYSLVMIGGAPFFMPYLEDALRSRVIVPLYSFSTRDSVEEKTQDGGTRKVSVFRHKGFIAAR